MKRLRAYNKFYRRYEVDLWGRAGFQRNNKTVRFLRKIQKERIRFNFNPGRTFRVRFSKKKKNISYDRIYKKINIHNRKYLLYRKLKAKKKRAIRKKQKELLSKINLSHFRANPEFLRKLISKINCENAYKKKLKMKLLKILISNRIVKQRKYKSRRIKITKYK